MIAHASLGAVMVCITLAQSQPYRGPHNGEYTPQPQHKSSNSEPSEYTEIVSTATQKEAQNGTKEKEQDSGSKRWLKTFISLFEAHDKFWVAFGTLIVAVFTVILGTATIFLWRATRALVKSAEQAAERQSSDMRESVAIGKQSADAAKTSADTGRKQFIAAHRPKVIIRRVSHTRVDGQDAVKYVIANTNDNVATIVEVSTRLWRELGGDKGDPEWKRYRTIENYSASVAASIIINSGEHVTEVACKQGPVFSQFDFPPGSIDTPEPKPEPTTGKDLLFLGYVVYEDSERRKRTTAFCRRYVKLTKRFVPIDDKDYEYQD